jgi:hypothetical protein
LGAPPRGWAAGSPTPFAAASSGIGLIAGPSRPLRSGIYRVRPLSPVRWTSADARSPDMVLTRLQLTRDRVTTVFCEGSSRFPTYVGKPRP